MRQFVILLACLVGWVAAASYGHGYEQKMAYLQNLRHPDKQQEQKQQSCYYYGTGDISKLPSVNQRQKFILDVLLQVQKPLVNDEIINLGQELITDLGRYIQPEDADLREFIEYCSKQEMPDRDILYNELNLSEARHQIGLYRFLVLARDYSTFQLNVAYARLHINPVMFVNALLLAVRDRADTQDLVVPALHEVLPQLFFDKHVIESAQKLDYSALSTGTATLKPTLVEVLNFGGRLNPILAIRFSKSSLSRPFYESRMGLTGVVGKYSQKQQNDQYQYQYNQAHETNYNYDDKSKIVIPAYRENTVAYLTDDIGLNTFWNNVIRERFLQTITGRRNDLIEGQQYGRIYRQQRYGFAQTERQDDYGKSSDSSIHQSQTQAHIGKKYYGYDDMKRDQKYNTMQYGIEGQKDRQNDRYDQNQNRDYGGRVALEKSYTQRGGLYDRKMYDQRSDYGYQDIFGNKYNSYKYNSLPETSIDSDRLLHVSRRRLLQQKRQQQDKVGQYEHSRYGKTEQELNSRSNQYLGSRKQYGQSGIENGRVVDEHRYRNCLYNTKDHKCSYYMGYENDYSYNQNKKQEQQDYEKYQQQYNNRQHYQDGERGYGQQYHYYGKYLPLQQQQDAYRYYYKDGQRIDYGDYQGQQQQYYKGDELNEENRKSGYGYDYGKYAKYGRIVDGDRLMGGRKYDNNYYYNNLNEERQKSDVGTENERIRRSIGIVGRNYNQQKDSASTSTYGFTPAQELMAIRSGEIFIQNLQQLVARITLEKIALKADNYDEHDRSYLQLLTTGGSLYQQSSHNNLIAEQSIGNAMQQLRSLIDSELHRQQISQNSEEVLKVIGDILMNLNGQQGGNIWDELYNKIKYDIYGQSSEYNYRNIATYLSMPAANLREPIYKQIIYELVQVIDQYKEKLEPYRIEDLQLADVSIEDVKVDKFLTYTQQFESDLINLVDQGQSQQVNLENIERKIVVRQERLNHEPFTISYALKAQKAQGVVVRTLLGPKFDENGNRVNLQQNRQNYIVLDAFYYNLTPGQNYIERSSHHIAPYAGRTVSTLSEIYKCVMTGQSLDDLISERARYPHRLLLPRGSIDGLSMQLFVVITPCDEDDKALQQLIDPKQVYGLGIPSLYLDSLPLSYPLDRPINVNEQELNQLPNILLKDVEIVHDHRQHNSGMGI